MPLISWENLFSYYILSSLGTLAIVLTLMHMLYKRRSPTSIISWLLFMIIAPYFFVVFYLLFGIRKRANKKLKPPIHTSLKKNKTGFKHPIDALLHNKGISSSSSENSMKIFTNPTEAYFCFYDNLAKAKKSIDISTYLLSSDSVTEKIFDLLVEKVDNGVDVRILIDTIGSLKLFIFQAPLKRLKKAGIKINFFMPLAPFNLRYKYNLRYHRKIYIIDEKTLFSGGMNLAQEYMGPDFTEQRWVDLLYKVEGVLVTNYLEVFESDWAYALHIPVKKIKTQNQYIQNYANHDLQIVPSGPDVQGDALLESILYGIYTSSKRIWIVTPYFIPCEPILLALRIAYHRGVEIKIITPNISNHAIADMSRSSYLRELQELGVDIALYNGSMLHAKSILFDDKAVILGSLNLDNRSLLLNYEVATISYSSEHIRQISQWMQTLLKNSSSSLKTAGKIRRIFENFMRIFALQL